MNKNRILYLFAVRFASNLNSNIIKLNSFIFTMFYLISISAFSQDIPKSKSIIGKWLIVNENGFSCNVCPNIEFNYDDFGFIELPSGELLHFTWHLNDSVLNFKFSEKRYFTKDTLFVNISSQDSLEVLILSSKQGVESVNYSIINDSNTFDINISNWIYKLVKKKNFVELE